MPESMHTFTFSSGARRSVRKPRFDLLLACRNALRRISDRFEMGLKYGEHNYKKGLEFDDTVNHIFDHLESYVERRKRYFELKENGNLAAEYEAEVFKAASASQGASSSAILVPKGTTSNISAEPTLEDWMRTTETDGDDLAAAAWGMIVMMELETRGKLLCTPTK